MMSPSAGEPVRQDVARESGGPVDTLGRPLEDLRISVTDRCNFRCPFCMPKEAKHRFAPRPEILTFEEITRLVGIFQRLGVSKVRLTGGEPLLRSEIEVLIEMLAGSGLDDLALTTNGWLLEEKAVALQAAGLDRVTVSLPTLDPTVFARSNGLGLPLERVLRGIDAATAAGLGPVKLNTVAVRGQTEAELIDLARFGRERGAIVRFIELMDVGTLNEWNPEQVLAADEIIERIDAVWPLEPVPRLTEGGGKGVVAAELARRGDVAHRWRYRDGGGEIGVIPSITQPFCGDCTRARLSADGRLYLCLFAAVGHDLKTPLREGASDREMVERVAAIWTARTDRYSEERTAALRAGRFVPAPKVEMYRIGG